MALCVTCHEAVIVGLTERGRFVPLQPGPDPSGPLAISEGPGGEPRIRYLKSGDTATGAEVRMMAHWDRSPRCRPPHPRSAARRANPPQLAAVG